jgi:hypothetical protein
VEESVNHDLGHLLIVISRDLELTQLTGRMELDEQLS